MKVTLKINGTKEFTITPETPLEHEYMALIKEAEFLKRLTQILLFLN